MKFDLGTGTSYICSHNRRRVKVRVAAPMDVAEPHLCVARVTIIEYDGG